MEMLIHGYEEGCGFNAATKYEGKCLWHSRQPMNAWVLRNYVARRPEATIEFSGDVIAARKALEDTNWKSA